MRGTADVVFVPEALRIPEAAPSASGLSLSSFFFLSARHVDQWKDPSVCPSTGPTSRLDK